MFFTLAIVFGFCTVLTEQQSPDDNVFCVLLRHRRYTGAEIKHWNQAQLRKVTQLQVFNPLFIYFHYFFSFMTFVFGASI